MLDRISSFAGSFQRGFQINSLQSQLNQLVGEVSSGKKADPLASLGTGAALLYQLQSQSDQQEGIQTALTISSQRLDTAQTALSTLASTLQTAAVAALGVTPGDATGYGAVGKQATSSIGQVLSLLSTSYLGAAVFGGDSVTPAVKPAGAAGGVSSVTQTVLSGAVSAKGGPLSKADVAQLVDGTDGLSSVFDDTNSNSALHYTGAVYTGSTDGQPTTVIIGTNQTVQYDTSANQPAFRDLMKGLSMLSLLSAPSSQLDDSAKAELASRASSVLATAQKELTALQGGLGTVQSNLSVAAEAQRTAADATKAQLLTYMQADTYSDATQITFLQTQLQATYTLTSQISQLSLVHFMPAS